MAKSKLYRQAVQWIADNDETAEQDPNVMKDLISVLLVADLFGVSPETVAQEIVAYRREANRVADAAVTRRNADRVDGFDRDDLGESHDY